MAYPTPGSSRNSTEDTKVVIGDDSKNNMEENTVKVKGVINAEQYVNNVRGISPELELVNLSNGIDVNVPGVIDRARMLMAADLLGDAIKLELMGSCLISGICAPESLYKSLSKYVYNRTSCILTLVVLPDAIDILNTISMNILLRGLKKYYPDIVKVKFESAGTYGQIDQMDIGQIVTGEKVDVTPTRDIITGVFMSELERDINILTMGDDLKPIGFKVVGLDYYNEIGMLCIYVDTFSYARNINERVDRDKLSSIISDYIPQLLSISISCERLSIIVT